MKDTSADLQHPVFPFFVVGTIRSIRNPDRSEESAVAWVVNLELEHLCKDFDAVLFAPNTPGS